MRFIKIDNGFINLNYVVDIDFNDFDYVFTITYSNDTEYEYEYATDDEYYLVKRYIISELIKNSEV